MRVAKRVELTHVYTPQQAELDRRLREWRKAEAATNGRPAFYVLTDAHLINVVMACPQNLSQLSEVKGISRAKAEQFGADIIVICRELTPSSGIKERASPIQQFGEITETFHRARTTPSDPIASLTPDQQLLDAQLRAWRKAESERIGLPQFFVLGSSALRSIVLLRPRTIAQLQTISGIGPDKAEQFGASILNICGA